MRVAVDCHMVSQPGAGDAGNARFATQLTHALNTTAEPTDEVLALVAHPHAREVLRDVRHVPVPDGNLARLLRGMPRALAHANADAVVVTYIAPPRTPCPTAVAVHDITFRLHPEWFSPRVRALLGTLVPRSLRRAGVVLTISERSKADIVSAYGVDPGRVHVVPITPSPVFTPDPDAALRVARDHGLDRYVLFVGDINPRKNLTALAAAMRRLGDPSLRLAVVGKIGHHGEEILSGAKATWLGPQDDMSLADLYRGAAVTCYPSLYEGFGLPVIEAMACGSPVVASNRGAIPEVAGDAAIIVEPTAGALADGIRAALDPVTAGRLRSGGPVHAARFSPERMGATAWGALRSLR